MSSEPGIYFFVMGVYWFKIVFTFFLILWKFLKTDVWVEGLHLDHDILEMVNIEAKTDLEDSFHEVIQG